MGFPKGVKVTGRQRKARKTTIHYRDVCMACRASTCDADTCRVNMFIMPDLRVTGPHVLYTVQQQNELFMMLQALYT
jgi:hypothetical protein